MGLRIEVDPEKCMGGGNCEFWAPNTFELGEDGVSHVKEPEGDPEEKVILAAQGCPTQAIAVWRDDEKIA